MVREKPKRFGTLISLRVLPRSDRSASAVAMSDSTDAVVRFASAPHPDHSRTSAETSKLKPLYRLNMCSPPERVGQSERSDRRETNGDRPPLLTSREMTTKADMTEKQATTHGFLPPATSSPSPISKASGLTGLQPLQVTAARLVREGAPSGALRSI